MIFWYILEEWVIYNNLKYMYTEIERKSWKFMARHRRLALIC